MHKSETVATAIRRRSTTMAANCIMWPTSSLSLHHPFFVRGDAKLRGLERRPIRLRARGKSGNLKRAKGNRSIVDRQAHRAVARMVEIRMRGEEALLFGGTRALAGEAIDVMVPVALDVGESEHACQRQVLLHRESRLHRQVLPGKEIAARCVPVPERTSGGVEQRFVDTLATLARDAGVA